MGGYADRIARIDLSSGSVTFDDVPFQAKVDYVGGAGLGSLIVFNEVPPLTDPLSAANKLVFMTGPLTGTSYPTAGRYEICTKSPLTGTLTDTSSGGFWGAALKKAGYDGIVVEGAAASPVYLFVNDDSVEIRDATALWGLDTEETQAALRSELGGDSVKVACIGPAGERGVLIACVVNDEGRAAGRGGAGAVMGSKMLKAIAVKGTGSVALADAEEFERAVRQVVPQISGNPIIGSLRDFGTAGTLDGMAETGDVPVKNWSGGLWPDGCRALGGAKMSETILRKHPVGCHRCPVHCSRWVSAEYGGEAFEGAGPEYETLAALGTLTLNDDLSAVAYANHLCNLYGIDTISAGVTIAFALEAHEKGALSDDRAAGLDLAWGDPAVLVRLVEQIGRREGLGELLGMGVKRASEALGESTRDYAMHTKGLETAMHDARAEHSMAVTYATSPRGACHMHGHSVLFEWGMISLPEFGITEPLNWHGAEKKGLAAKLGQDLATVYNSLVVCVFAAIGTDLAGLAEVVGYATGIEHDAASLMKAGERVCNLQRLYNLRAGFTSADDVLPQRQLTPSAEVHAAPPFQEMLLDYYEERGWDPQGVPGRAKLKELGLER